MEENANAGAYTGFHKDGQPMATTFVTDVQAVEAEELHPLQPRALYTFKMPILCCLLGGFHRQVTVDVVAGDITLEAVYQVCCVSCSDCRSGVFLHTSVNDVVVVEDQYQQKCYWGIRMAIAWFSFAWCVVGFFIVPPVALVYGFFNLIYASYATARWRNIRWCVFLLCSFVKRVMWHHLLPRLSCFKAPRIARETPVSNACVAAGATSRSTSAMAAHTDSFWSPRTHTYSSRCVPSVVLAVTDTRWKPTTAHAVHSTAVA
jgi:hypothetical protein